MSHDNTKTFQRFAPVSAASAGKGLRRSVIVPLAMLVSLSSYSSIASVPDSDAAPVGQVSLVIGKAWLHSEGRKRQPIRTGTVIQRSDTIITEANGHVHIRFVDDGLLSVRPDSRLEITHYEYNASSPADSTIKLHLKEGVTRSISGDGARSARDRFRLNTPIAAIGVRGTDFVVSASRASVRAMVNEGAIVMAPFSADCLADAFGPCSQNAIELSDSSLQMVQVDSSGETARLLPAPHERDPALMREEVQLAIAVANPDAEEKTAGTDVYLETVTSRRVAGAAVALNPRPPAAPTPVAPPPAAPVDFMPSAALSATALSGRDLVWAQPRAIGSDTARERITLAYGDASPDRQVTVGFFNSYTLFRNEPLGTQRVKAGLGPVSFNLHSAQAFYHSGTGIVAMAVRSGNLDINFDNNTFATQLKMNHSQTGNVDFAANGRIYDGGYFHMQSPTERMAGAVSISGGEAGYIFEKQIDGGAIQGLTLWDKR
jgi:hypothetical protein